MNKIKTLHLVIGTKCNQRCKMCYQGEFNTIINSKIWKEKLNPLYPQLQRIVLQGGEPTAICDTKDFIEHVLSINPKIKFEIATNGKTLDQFWIEFLCHYGHTVNISINASTKLTYDQITKSGDFDRVIVNIKKIVRQKSVIQSSLLIRLSFVVLSENLHQVPEFILMAKQLGATDIIFYFDTSNLPTQEKEAILATIDRAIELRDKHTNLNIYNLDHIKNYFTESHSNKNNAPLNECPKGLNQLFVDQHGQVRSCCLNVMTLGNLHTKNLENIFQGKKMIKLQKDIIHGKYRYCRPECSLLRDVGIIKRKTPLLSSLNALALDFVQSPRSTLKKISRQFHRFRP